ncbi:MAG: transglycosylase SLT domain-containing protein [Acidimicrobiales bacterium]
MHPRVRRTAALGAVVLSIAACGSDEVGSDAGRTVVSAPSPAPGADRDSTTTTEAQSPDRPPELAAEPPAIAAQLVEAERAILDVSTPDDELAEAARVQQYAYRVLAANPEWDDEVRAAVPSELHDALHANVEARRELRGMHTHLLETLPAWRIVEPPPLDELMGHYLAAEEAYGVPWEYLAAIHRVETAIGRVDGVSVAGAQGPMQFMPDTWDAFGEGDVHDHGDAIMAAARYLNHSGAPGDMGEALFSYNRHHNYVRAIEHYASVIRDDPNAFRGYYHWQVYVLTTEGEVVMPVGFDEDERVPVEEYLAGLG